MKEKTAGQKAAETRRKNIEAMTPAQRAEVTRKRREAAKKAVETKQQNELKAKISEAVKKAWETR